MDITQDDVRGMSAPEMHEAADIARWRVKVGHGAGNQAPGLWCRMVDVGAHQACGPLLQALFMTARALPTTSTVTVRTINREVFIATSPERGPTPTDLIFLGSK
jgi:hypothetical protein